MVFKDKYELLALRGGDREIALPGREICSAKPVLLHLLAGGYAPENQELLRALGNLSADQRGHVLDSGDHDGIPYVVTDTLPGNPSLRSWVAAAVVAAPSPKIESTAPASAPIVEAGEFTRLFQAIEKPPEVPAKPAPETSTATMEAPPAAPAEPEIGEFTRLLRTPAPAGPKAAPAPQAGKAVPTVTPQEEPAAQPGEFTRMFQPQSRVAAAAASASGPPESTGLFQGPAAQPTPRSSEPGEFTQAMQPPLAAKSNYPKPAAPAAVPRSEFTRMMDGSGLPKPPVISAGTSPQARPPESPQSQGEFTRIFEAEPSPTGNLAAPATPQAPLLQGGVGTVIFSQRAAPTGSAGPSAPSEFTQFAMRSPAPVAPAPKAPQAAASIVPPVVKANRKYLSLILILAGLFLLALILILVLVLMR